VNPGEETTSRIRWEPRDGELLGSVGTFGRPVFRIWPPGQEGERVLLVYLAGEAQHMYHDDSADSENALKAKAESLLAEFVSSLGAVFPEGDGWPGRGWAYVGRDRDGNLILKHEESGGLYHVIPEEDL
jgi:hypothetical protein